MAGVVLDPVAPLISQLVHIASRQTAKEGSLLMDIAPPLRDNSHHGRIFGMLVARGAPSLAFFWDAVYIPN